VSGACLICLGAVAGSHQAHPRCVRALFGATALPRVELDTARLHTAGLAMVGRASISGVQRKISMTVTADRATLQVALDGGRYLLKPRGETFPALPENEHLTMRLAGLVGLEVARCGLIPLADGGLAYIVARFDRTPDGGKLRMEDFCQLAERSPKDKYRGSAELVARLVRRYATEPGVELARLYRLLLFSWWVGNGDLHLKNLALLTGPDGRHRLSPAYDLLSTRLVIPEDRLALPVGGRDDQLGPAAWRRFGRYCGLPDRAIERAFTALRDALEPALTLIAASPLPADLQASYEALLRERADRLDHP